MLRVREQRARERDALALPARQRQTLLADDGVVAVRQPHDELVGFGRARRGLDLRRGRVGRAERDVGRIVSEKRNESSNTTPMLRAQRLQASTSRTSVPSIVTRAVRARRRSAAAAAPTVDLPEPDVPTSATVSPGVDREREVAQHRLGRRVAERDAVERARAAGHVEQSVASGRSCTSGVESSRSKMRSAPARASWPTVRIAASIRTGGVSRSM